MWNKSGGSDAAEPGKHLVRDLQERQEWAPLQPRVIEEIELEESYSRRERTRVTLTGPPASASQADPADPYPAWKRKLFDAAALLVSAASVTALVIEEYQRQFPLLRQYPTLTTVVVIGLLGVMTFYGRRLTRR